MRTGRKPTEAILGAIARGNRSPLFWWMVEHHDEIAARAGERIHWDGVCAKAAELGLTDTTGSPPSRRNARETWRQARLYVAKARERRAQQQRPGSTPPSRISPDWRPQAARPASGSAAPATLGAPLPAALAPIGQIPTDPAEFPTVDPSGAPLPEGYVFYRGRALLLRVALEFAKLDRQFKEMDRYK